MTWVLFTFNNDMYAAQHSGKSRACWRLSIERVSLCDSVAPAKIITLNTRRCERLSAMRQQAMLPQFLVQNSLNVPTQVFQECWSGIPPPPNANLDRFREFGFELVWSTHHPSTYVGAGVWRLIAGSPQRYPLVFSGVPLLTLQEVVQICITAEFLLISRFNL